MSEMKGLISSVSRKWKIEPSLAKNLEIENRLMEERLMQLKADLNFEKQKRSSQGGAIWDRGTSGPLSTYAKNVLQTHKANNNINLNEQKPIKLKVLKDDIMPVPPPLPKEHLNSGKDKSNKCGQCEKKLAFVQCVECCEDYCVSCFATFHAKGALKKHRTVPYSSNKTRVKTPIIDVLNSPSQSRKSSSNVSERKRVDFCGYQMIDSTENYEDDENWASMSNTEIVNNGGVLLNGNYDEKAEADAFKKAVEEWRHGSKKSNESSNRKFTETNGTSTDDRPQSALRKLEINFEHSLSYAERLLLKKYRRSDVEEFFGLNTATNDYHEDPQIETEKSLHASKSVDKIQHINFDSLVQMVKSDKKEETNEEFDEKSDKNIEIVEIKDAYSSLNLDLGPLTSNIKTDSLINEELNDTSRTLTPKIKQTKSRPSTAKRPSSSRIQSARPKSSLSNTNKITESNLTRKPSDALKTIANRQVSSNIVYSQQSTDLNKFFMLEVNQEENEIPGQKAPQNTARPLSSTQKFKLSYKLYEMSPRSWKPHTTYTNETNTLSNENANNYETKTNYASMEIEKNSIELRQSSSSSLTIVTKLNEDLNDQMPSNKSISLNKNTSSSVRNSSNNSSLNLKEKTSKSSVKTNDTLEFQLSKGMTATWKPSTPSLPKSRPSSQLSLKTLTKKSANNTPRSYSVMSRCETPSNRDNMSFGHEFENYDEDDGRSSRIVQNKDDDVYFSQLGSEFAMNLDANDPFDIKKYFSTTSTTAKSGQTKTSATYRGEDDDYDDYDDTDLDMEDLRKL